MKPRFNLIGRYARLPGAEKLLLVDAGCLLVLIRLALWSLPLNAVIRLIGRRRGVRRESFSVARLEWAVRSVSRAVPRATCLTQAIALHRLLLTYGYHSTVQIGVTKEPDGVFQAHAWVEQAGLTLLDSANQVNRYSRLLTISVA